MILDINREIESHSIHKLAISGDMDKANDFDNDLIDFLFERKDINWSNSYGEDTIGYSVECWTEFASELLEETVLELVLKFSGEVCVEWS